MPPSFSDASWEECWEDILRLPLEALPDAELFKEAKRIVRMCRSSGGYDGRDLFEAQVEEGLSFVAEELAVNSNDIDWRRIEAVLSGARAGLRDDA